jgi:exodeoxyribonuclease V gamma subunit
MVPFSPAAFCGEHPSYAQEWLPVVNQRGEKRTPFIQPLEDSLLDAVYPLDLPLVELQRFWRLPVQYFFNRRLKVFFADGSAGTDDDEPFALDNLQGYQLREQLIAVMLEARLTGADEDQMMQHFIRAQRAKGLLPIGAFGELEFAESQAQSAAIVEELAFICQSPLADAEVNIRLTPFGEDKPVQLTGWLAGGYQSGLVRYRSGRIRPQDLLSAWIDHLCLAVSGDSRKTHLIGYDRKEGVEHRIFAPLGKSEAEAILTELIHHYYAGLNAPMVFFPRSLMAGAEMSIKGKEAEEIYAAMQKQFENGFNTTGEGANSYIARVWPQWSESLAKQLWENVVFLLSAIAHSEDNQAAEASLSE